MKMIFPTCVLFFLLLLLLLAILRRWKKRESWSQKATKELSLRLHRINNSLFTDCLDIRSFYNEESRPEGWSEKKKGDSKDGFCRAIEIFFMLEEEMKSFLFVSVQLFCLLPFRKKTFSTKSASEWSALPFKAFESLHNSWMDSRKTFYLSFRMGLRDESKRVFTARRTCYQCDGWEWCGKFPFRQSLLMLLLRLWMERKRKMFLVVHA